MLIRFGDEPQLSQLGLLCNTGNSELLSNVAAACSLGLPEVQRQPVASQGAVICGGGPSLTATLESIRALKASGAKLYALNNTAELLSRAGIRPDAQVIVDPRAGNIVFLNQQWADELLLASQCHADLFARAKSIGYPVRLYHTADEAVRGAITNPNACYISGGTTVGLTALCLAHALGHRDLYLFGYDSSHAAGVSHAYAQPMNAADEMVRCVVDSQVFDCSLGMAGQAHEFRGIAQMLAAWGTAVHVYGDGLLPTMWRIWQRERTQRILTACYDLGLCSPDFSFAAFLSAADRYRKKNHFDQMDVVFQPGPMHGFKYEELMPQVEGLKDMLWRICVAHARKHPAVRNIEVLGARRTVPADAFPEGYAEQTPKIYQPEAQPALEKTS